MAYTDAQITIAGNILSGWLNPGISAGSLGTLSTKYPIPNIPGATFALGTGAGKFNLMTVLAATLTAATEEIDLTTLTDPGGQAINFARIKGYGLFNFSVAGGSSAGNLIVGGAASNPWAAPFDGTGTSKLVVGPGPSSGVPGGVVHWFGDATGLAVSGTSKVLKLDSGAATVPWVFIPFGNDA